MQVFRRSSVIALVAAIGMAMIAATVAVICAGSPGALAVPLQPWSKLFQTGPKAVVDEATWDLGIIESGEEFAHNFVIRNEGDAPLQLARGPSTCKCMVAQLPESPLPAGGQAEVHVGPTDAAKSEELKAGPIARTVEILTSDPDHASLSLKLKATVQRRLAAATLPLTLLIHAPESASEAKRSAETVVYSQVWDGFELAAARTSQEAMQWRIEPAAPEELETLKARSGYRVQVTLPPDVADGHFAQWIDLAASPSDAAAQGAALRLEIQGRVEGRLTFHGHKISGGKLLRLGVLQAGECLRESLLMKIHDQQRSLRVEAIETEPTFVRAHVEPQGSGSAGSGFYRITVEIPGNAPSCAFTGQRPATIRLKTDHPRLPVIELKVDFVVLGGQQDFRHVSAR